MPTGPKWEACWGVVVQVGISAWSLLTAGSNPSHSVQLPQSLSPSTHPAGATSVLNGGTRLVMQGQRSEGTWDRDPGQTSLALLTAVAPILHLLHPIPVALAALLSVTLPATASMNISTLLPSA